MNLRQKVSPTPASYHKGFDKSIPRHPNLTVIVGQSVETEPRLG